MAEQGSLVANSMAYDSLQCRRLVWRVALCCAVLLQLPVVAVAQDGQTRWITDKLEITMRTGKSTRQKIVRVLPSGARVELLEVDDGSGYAKVRTSSGAEGWVLSRYLLKSPPARVVLPDLQKRLQASEVERERLRKANRELRQENSQLKRRIAELESDGSDLQRQLAKIRKLSSNAIQLNEQNQELRQRLSETEAALTELQAENERLSGRSSREWFVVGAGVVVFGMLLGLILPRIRWRRKSSWSDL